jgi:glycosyltransferase involved in cell wall biosynthesis/GT2 family glycosyltransferase
VRVSVVISTYNRATSLAQTLAALQWQRHRDFEVVVVDGPSDDRTAEVLAGWGDAIRVLRTDDRNLSRSRNIGLAAAAGEIVAFIDDDAIPESRWLEDLVALYADDVDGVGGLVLDHTGVHAQYTYSVCDRIGRTTFDVLPTADRRRDVDDEHFVYLQGTNMSFRRSALARIGGFDEEIEYNYDEVEVALRLAESGAHLRTTDGAVVHHKFLPSHQRGEKGLFTDPFLPIKNRVYFALSNGTGHLPLATILGDLAAYRDGLVGFAESCEADGRFDVRTATHFYERLDAGFELGMERGLRAQRQSVEIPDAREDDFRPFPRIVPETDRMTVCFVSLDYPPARVGGVARYTADLARDLAHRGHDVHVVTRDDGPDRLDLEDGVWVHRVPGGPRWLPGLDGHPLRDALAHLAQVRGAVERIHRRTPIDVLNGNLWIAEPLLAAVDPRLRSVLTCATPMRVVAQTHESVADDPSAAAQILLEDHALTQFDHLHSLSEANLRTLEVALPDIRESSPTVLPLGMRDRRDGVVATPSPEGTVEVLFVGRLEPRKGIDVFVRAAAALLERHPGLRVRVVGADNPHGGRDDDRTWAERALAEVSSIPGAAERLIFEGEIPDEELYERFASCDVFCAPSRYESFGLVLLEAMMFGKPSVSCRAGGIPEVAADGETALLVEPDDADALEAALERLIADADLRRRMGAAARERFETEFEQSVATARTEALFARVIAEHPKPRMSEGAAFRASVAATAAALERLGLPAPRAASAARALLEPRAFPVDVVGVAAAAAGQAPSDAAGTLYTRLLGREADPAGVAAVTEALRNAPALDFVRVIADADEGRAMGLDPDACDVVIPAAPDDALRVIQGALWRDDATFAETVGEVLTAPEADLDVRDLLEAGLAERRERVALVREALEHPDVAWRIRGIERLRAATLWTVDGLTDHLRSLSSATDEAFVAALYRALLDREPDPDGAGAWTSRLNRGAARATVVGGLAESAEAQARGIDPHVVLTQVVPAVPALAVPGARRPLRQRVTARAASRAQALLGVPETRAQLAGLGGQNSDVLARAQAELEALERVHRAVDGVSNRLIDRLDTLQERSNALQRDIVSVADGTAATRSLLEAHTGEVQQLSQHLSRNVAQASGGVQHLAGGVQHLTDRIDVLAGKQGALALDVREKLPDQPTVDDVIEPDIVDPDAIARVREERGGLFVNVGCGEKPLPGYVNVDFRPLPGVAVVADARHMPFEPGTVDEIMSAHLVEHFRQRHVELHLLPAWRRLLAPGGCVRIICPNWEEMIARLNAGVMTFAEFKLVTFGAQDYSGDDHFAMYSPGSLTASLRTAGFERFEVLETKRMNGLSPEIELLAWPAESASAVSSDPSDDGSAA